MSEDNNDIPIAYQFRLRMHELLCKAMDDGIIERDQRDLDTLDSIGFTVFGGDPLLQQNPSLVADLVGYELGGLGVTENDLVTVVQGMRARRYYDEFNRD